MLDKSKGYGLSVGHPIIAYLQDGKCFNAKGAEVNSDGSSIEPPNKPILSMPMPKKRGPKPKHVAR